MKGVTTTDDKDRLVQAVRLVRPEKRITLQLETYQQSAWEVVDRAVWRATWDAEVAAADPFITREMCLATGLLLPIWSHLPQTSAQVRRVKAPDGRRWLGRVLDSVEATQLKVALGLTDTASMVATEGVASDLILKDGASVSLPSGLWLRRARVMDGWRIEVVGGAPQRSAFQAVGCVVEIINYQPRVFVPTVGPALSRVLERWPAQSVLPKAA